MKAHAAQRVHRINSQSTPTPATDGERVYVYFGSYGLVCYDLDGELLWDREIELPPLLYGTSASLILAEDKLIFSNDNKNGSYLDALDPATGETLWRAERPSFTGSWSSPMYWDNAGVPEVVVYGIWFMVAYDLQDGTETWRLPGLTDEPCITPVSHAGLIYLSSYNMKTNPEVLGLPEWSKLIADYDEDEDGELTFKEIEKNKSILSRIDADGEGDHPLPGFFRYLDVDRNGQLTATEWDKMIAFLNSFEQVNGLLAIRPPLAAGEQAEIVWQHSRGVPECPSPLYHEGLLYMVKNGGIATCLDALTGEQKYFARLDSGGPYYSSPVLGDGKIYAASARGVVTVYKAGEELEILAHNDLDERIMATPALLEGKIYVRTERHLYAFGARD